MFNLHVEINGEPVSLDAYGSAVAAVRECHSMARTYAEQVDSARTDDDVTMTARAACDLMFGKGVDQQVRREKFFAASVKGRKPSKSNPSGVSPQPVVGQVGAFVFSITPSLADVSSADIHAAVEAVTV